jgi:hypothetical protein
MDAPALKTLYKCLLAQGWSAVDPRTNPRAYADSSGKRFGTLERGGVRLAISTGQELIEERGTVIVYMTDEQTDVILRALIVDSPLRKRGLAGHTLKEVAALSDSLQATIYLEPVPIEDKPLDEAKLGALYTKHGFEFVSAKRQVMVRRAKKDH